MSSFEMFELIFGYTLFWTLLVWICIALFAFLLWWLVFHVLFRESNNINSGGGYQSKITDEKANKFPSQGMSGGKLK